MKTLRLLSSFLLLFTFALGPIGTAFGQERTGSIEGTVTDSSGARVPDANVKIEGAAFTRNVTTGSDGFYRVLLVPPGTYTVTASANNFSSTKNENVLVVLGKASVTDLALQPGGVSEQVTISAGDVATIDPTGNKVQTSVSERQIELTPKGVNFSTVLQVSPATRNEPLNAGFQIDGSSGAENTFIIDGLEVTNFRTGQLRTVQNIPFEFVKEVQVKSSGFEAEFGGATGGVVNVVTKSGSNDWHGMFGTQISSDLFDGSTRPILRGTTDKVEYIRPQHDGRSFLNPKDDTFTNHFPSGTLSGPIVKDRLWFLGSFAPQFYRTERIRTFTDGSTEFYRQELRRDYGFFRMDASVFDKLQLTGTYTYNPQREHGQLEGFDSTASPGPFDDRGGRVAANNFTYQGVYTPTPAWVISLRGGRNYLNEKDGSYGVPSALRIRCFTTSNANLPGVTPAGRCDPGFANIGSTFGTAKDISIRNTFDADASVLLNNLAGRHVFKFGYQLNKINNDVDQGYFNTGEVRLFFGSSSSAGSIPIGVSTGARGYGYLQRFGTAGEAASKNQSFYVQDSWTVFKRLTLNLGFRLEKENIPTFSATGDEIVFNWGDKPAPRLGFAFDVFGDGKTKIFASYGWFYDRFKYELPRGSFGGDKFTREYFNIVNPNWNFYTIPNINAISVAILDFRVPSNDPADNRIDPNLKAARADEFTVGIERELWGNMVGRARYTHKRIDRTIEDVGTIDDQGNENYFIANPGFGVASVPFASGLPATPKAERTYDAVEFSLDKRFSNNYYLNASYTYSRLFGNYSGLASSDENGRSSPNVNRFFDLPFLGFTMNGVPDNGRLATDRPHAVKFFGGYTYNWFGSGSNSTDFTLGFVGQSGTPLSTRINFFNAATFLFGRGDLGRTEAFTQTDIAITHRVKFAERYQVAFEANILNLFDEKNVLQIQNIISTDNLSGSGFTNCGTCDELDAFRAVFSPGLTDQIVNRLASGSLNRDARFLSPNNFQAPRQVRLGVRFIF